MKSAPSTGKDVGTAQAFSTSWNNLPQGSVYTTAQYQDWMLPLREEDIRGKNVLEMGCGNASLLLHTARWQPRKLTGIDLGDSVIGARENVKNHAAMDCEIIQADMCRYEGEGYDVVYSIGVLHHLKRPEEGLANILRNTKPGGRFHCWVYGREGNGFVIHVLDPVRKMTSRLPWYVLKYLICAPLSLPLYAYGKSVQILRKVFPGLPLPLAKSMWIERNDLAFYRHILMDLLVTPETKYLSREDVERLLEEEKLIDPGSTYITQRGSNSWRFGGSRVA